MQQFGYGLFGQQLKAMLVVNLAAFACGMLASATKNTLCSVVSGDQTSLNGFICAMVLANKISWRSSTLLWAALLFFVVADLLWAVLYASDRVLVYWVDYYRQSDFSAIFFAASLLAHLVLNLLVAKMLHGIAQLFT